MPQSKWERGFWAAVRGGGSFNPYPPEHWRKPKKAKKVKKRLKKDFIEKHVRILGIPDSSKQLTFFD